MIPTPNVTLLLIQCGCFSTTLMLALMLLLSRYQMRMYTPSRAYETSRWLLFVALSLYALHYLLQMIFGFRAKDENLGAMVNILFYLPIAVLLASATLRLSASHRYLRRFMTVGFAGFALNTLFFVAVRCYGDIHMPWVLTTMEVVYVLMIIFIVINPATELRRTYLRVEAETADPNTEYNLYMRSSTILLYTMGLVGALSIFSTRMVMIVAAFFLLALIFYVACFLLLGVSIQALNGIIEESSDSGSDEAGTKEADDESPATSSAPALRITPEQVKQVSEAIAAWRAKQGYGTSNLTSVTMAQRLGIPKRLLTQYLTQCEGNTFRVWLSNIRIEEAKHMLIDTNYSIEAVCEACGFSSRSWMTEKFKASTGMTPGEWREAQKKG